MTSNTPPPGEQIVDRLIVDPDGSPCPLLDKLPAEVRVQIYRSFDDDASFLLYCDGSLNWIAVKVADQKSPLVNLMRTCRKIRSEVIGERSIIGRAIVMASRPDNLVVVDNYQASATTSMVRSTPVYSCLSPSGRVYSPLSLDRLPLIMKSVDKLEIQIDIDPFGIRPSVDALGSLMEALSWGDGVTELTLAAGLKTRWSSEDWSGFSDMPLAWAFSDLWNKINANTRASSELPKPLEENWFNGR